MSETAVIEVHDLPERHRYVITVDGATAGVAMYRLREDVITFIHTTVDDAYGGRGLGSRLAAAALDDARRRGLRVIARCPFIAGFITEHPAYQDLLA
ncbi:MAG: GNAT family N-acetyltransferase [Candidatus Limnocylindrales bacterium]